ncbi:MAG: tetratricopeptide repeat protein [Candidatus Scalinduaceae bacterium]
MVKPITTLESHRIYLVTQVIKIVLLIMLLVSFALPACAQVKLFNELETKALMLHKQGQYSEAVNTAKEALKVAEETFGSDHPDVATLLNNLAMLYNAQGKYAKAKYFYERSQSILGKTLEQEPNSLTTRKKAPQIDKTWSGPVYATKYSRLFHRPDCGELINKSEGIIEFVSREHATRDGAIACPACNS